MPFPQHIPINTTPESIWLIMDYVESDYKDELTDVKADSDTDFVNEIEEKEEEQSLDSAKNSQP